MTFGQNEYGPGPVPPSSVITPRLGVYMPTGWGVWWKAARNAGRARISIVGGSSSAGYYSSNIDNKGWVGVLRDSLQALYGDGGSGFKGCADTTNFMTNQTVPAGAQSVYVAAGNTATLTGTWSQSGNDFGPGCMYYFTSTVNDTATFPTVRGTTINIYTVSGAGSHGNWTYSIDGAAPVTVNDSGSGGTTIQKTAVSGLAAGNHSVVLTFIGGGTFLAVCGVAGENVGGVVVEKFARYGAASLYVSNVDTVNNVPWNGGVNYPCDLAIYTCAPNDAANNIAGDAYAKNVRKYFEAVRGGGSQTGANDLMVVLPHIGTYDGTNFLYQDYAARLRGICEAYGAALIDFWTLGRNSWNYWNSLNYWGNASNPVISGSDNVHPSDAGHAYIASVIQPYLTVV